MKNFNLTRLTEIVRAAILHTTTFNRARTHIQQTLKDRPHLKVQYRQLGHSDTHHVSGMIRGHSHNTITFKIGDYKGSRLPKDIPVLYVLDVIKAYFLYEGMDMDTIRFYVDSKTEFIEYIYANEAALEALFERVYNEVVQQMFRTHLQSKGMSEEDTLSGTELEWFIYQHDIPSFVYKPHESEIKKTEDKVHFEFTSEIFNTLRGLGTRERKRALARDPVASTWSLATVINNVTYGGKPYLGFRFYVPEVESATTNSDNAVKIFLENLVSASPLKDQTAYRQRIHKDVVKTALASRFDVFSKLRHTCFPRSYDIVVPDFQLVVIGDCPIILFDLSEGVEALNRLMPFLFIADEVRPHYCLVIPKVPVLGKLVLTRVFGADRVPETYVVRNGGIYKDAEILPRTEFVYYSVTGGNALTTFGEDLFTKTVVGVLLDKIHSLQMVRTHELIDTDHAGKTMTDELTADMESIVSAQKATLDGCVFEQEYVLTTPIATVRLHVIFSEHVNAGTAMCVYNKPDDKQSSGDGVKMQSHGLSGVIVK